MADMRLIDANALDIDDYTEEFPIGEYDYGWNSALQVIEKHIEAQDTIDAVPVVRCKDCKKSRPIDRTKRPQKYFGANCVVCECWEVVGDENMIYEPMHFCSYGERKDDGA